MVIEIDSLAKLPKKRYKLFTKLPDNLPDCVIYKYKNYYFVEEVCYDVQAS